MDKIHTKTNKLFDEIRKHKIKLTKNANKDATKLSKADIADLSYKCCIYCEKVFFNSKFLMKHLLRRHSDELVLFYRNCTNRDFNYTSNDLQHLIDILQKEFSSLKEELCSANLAVEKKHEDDSFKKNEITPEEQATRTIKKTENNNGDIVSNEISDLKEKMLDVEKDIQNLNDKFIQLDNVLKNEVLKKQDVHEKLALSEEKIMQAQESQFNELRQILLNELKSILHNQQQDINSEWKSQLLELKYEIKRLDYAINNVQQITSIDSLKEEIRKELMPQIIPHIRSTKCGKKKHHHSLAKSELSFHKSHLSSQQRKLSEEQTSCKKSNSKSREHHPEISLENVNELASMVADKLSEFSIAPNTSKLSSAEFNKISKFINFEKEQLKKKYHNFFEIYNKINKTANQRAHSKLKSKKHHKIKFSEPLTSSRISLNHSVTSFEDSMPEQPPSIKILKGEIFSSKNPLPSNSKNISGENMCQTNEITSFTLPDKGASGDSVHPYSHKQKISEEHTNFVKRVEASSPIEDIVNSRDVTASFSNNDIAVSELHKYKRHTNSLPVEQKEFNLPVISHSLQFKEKEKFAFPDKGDTSEFSHPITNKQIMPLKHKKISYAKEFGNSSTIIDNENSKVLNSTFTKDSIIVSTGQISHKNQKKLNSSMGNHTVLFEESPIFKTLEKLSELDEYSKSDDEFDDVSSLETYKSSDDEKDPAADCS